MIPSLQTVPCARGLLTALPWSQMPKESEPMQIRAPSSEQGVLSEEVLLLSEFEEPEEYPVGAGASTLGAAEDGRATETEVAKVV